MPRLSANLNYYLFNSNVDLRKDISRLCESIKKEMSLDPSDASNIYVHLPEPEGCKDSSLQTWFLFALWKTSCHKGIQSTFEIW